MRAGNSSPFVLASMGDSQTAARVGGAAMFETYSARCAKSRGCGTFINAGISGHTTTQMLARFTSDLLKYWPSSVSLMGGPNDMTTNISGGVWVGGGISTATTKANLKSMVQQAQAQRAKVTLLSFFPILHTAYPANSATYLAAFEEITAETGCVYVDIYSAVMALSSEDRTALYIGGDQEHPSAAGHAFIAQTALAIDGAFDQFTP